MGDQKVTVPVSKFVKLGGGHAQRYGIVIRADAVELERFLLRKSRWWSGGKISAPISL